ncbi:MAG: hypothetical protein E4G99_12900 [Anaerolineales bacterium]|nr:MAG: hypothetical protein E4G99_12900 [Anaerolineales bacterium]
MKTTTLLRFISCGRLIPLGFGALIFAAVVGGTSMAGAPEFNLGLVEGIVCPGDSSLVYRLGESETSFEFPSASNPIGDSSSGRSFTVRCVRDGETLASGDRLLVGTLAAVLGSYFLACFLPLLVASSGLLWILKAKLKADS